uniref:INO80 complex subunit B-like conserved region domain-containing protein n=1 Tax=Ananas comosus var. bracteatus TaxID=296719 RepID=A0A6V7NEL5_ANACO|nr:unnamed protein product [Ananas comosus var. bracteatus]
MEKITLRPYHHHHHHHHHGVQISGFAAPNSTVRKRRSVSSRRPRPEAQLNSAFHDIISPSPTPPLSNLRRGSSGNRADAYYLGSDLKRCSEGVLSPANWKSSSKIKESAEKEYYVGKSGDVYSMRQQNMSGENKLRKVKLKVGGVTRTIQTKPNSVDAFRHRQKLSPQGDYWNDSAGSSFAHGMKENEDKNHNVPSSSEPVRKSKRVPKKRVLDGEFDDEEDDEIRYLEKLRTSKIVLDSSIEFEDIGEDSGWKKEVKIGRETNDNEYAEEEEPPSSDGGPDAKRKKQKPDSPVEARTEPLTTRQRALQSGKGGNGGSFIEFPNGLPPPPSRRQKEKLSEVEIQAKKAEAAQRRKMQVEKAARESEAEAIRKILGLDNDKKKEEKKQKEREEKEKAAKSQKMAENTIKWVMGPNGTVVTFPANVGLPSIFNSKPHSYPLRERNVRARHVQMNTSIAILRLNSRFAVYSAIRLFGELRSH